MQITIGSNQFDVRIPIIWGSRVLVAHPGGTYSLLLFEDGNQIPEIVKGQPGEGIDYLKLPSGFLIRRRDEDMYKFLDTGAGVEIVPIGLNLAPIVISGNSMRVGGMMLQGNMIASEVGVTVTEEGIGIGGRLPPEWREFFG